MQSTGFGEERSPPCITNSQPPSPRSRRPRPNYDGLIYRDEHPFNLRFTGRRTTGGGVDSVVSFCEGAAAWSSSTGSDSDGAGTGSEDAASVVPTALASFGMSASYSILMRAMKGKLVSITKEGTVGRTIAWLIDSSRSSLEIKTPSSSLTPDSEALGSGVA